MLTSAIVGPPPERGLEMRVLPEASRISDADHQPRQDAQQSSDLHHFEKVNVGASNCAARRCFTRFVPPERPEEAACGRVVALLRALAQHDGP